MYTSTPSKREIDFLLHYTYLAHDFFEEKKELHDITQYYTNSISVVHKVSINGYKIDKQQHQNALS